MMKLRKRTEDEIWEELSCSLAELCEDVFLLDCLCSAGEDGNGPDFPNLEVVRAESKRRLVDYILQHTGDTARLARALLACPVTAAAPPSGSL